MSDLAITTRTACPYCGVGCGVLATPQADGVVDIKGDADHPANFGRLCSKGSALGETLSLDGRLLYPEVEGRRTSWDTALDLVAARFEETIRDHGPDSVAFYVSGQVLTEDYYVANKLMKGFIGSANIDTNSRLCMASSVAGHRRAFGSDTVPGNYEDLELADLVVLTGSNLAWCHPVLFQRIQAAKAARPEMRIVVIDPRRTMTADAADLFLPIRPDGDVALFSGLLAYLEREGAIDADYVAAHTDGFVAALNAVCDLGIDRVAAATGLDAGAVRQFYHMFTATPKVVMVFSQGVNQSAEGTDKVNAIINCHLATGRIGKPGAGPFSVTGQPNAMGGREVGGLANTLAAHMELERPDHRDLVKRFWSAPIIAEKPGLKAVDLFRAVGEGRIRALWIMGTNPVDSMPDGAAVEAAIAACPFVVVSDVVSHNDTIRHATVKLPALAWGEKDGTVTNSERRITRQRAFLLAPGEARADWWQMAGVGRRMGHAKAFAWETASEVFAEHAALSGFENDGSRDFDISAHGAISQAGYAALAPFQWPQPRGTGAVETRFFADGGFFTPDRRARFVATPPQALADDDGMLTLNTGRVRDHWHTMTRTAKSSRLSAHMAEPYAEIHPEDAAIAGIADAGLVRVSNGSGHIIVRALVSDRQRRGSVFVPIHWTDQMAANARVDRLVSGVTDPVSGQPASKSSHVSVAPFEAAIYGFAVMADEPQGPGTAYWVKARAPDGWRIEFADDQVLANAEDFAARLAGFAEQLPFLGYRDGEAGDTRLAAFAGDRLAMAMFLGASPVGVSRAWAVSQLAASHADIRARFKVVAGRPGAGMRDAGATVCSCFSIGRNDIVNAVRDGCTSVAAIGEILSAGTNCGSCRSEIKGIIDELQIVAAE